MADPAANGTSPGPWHALEPDRVADALDSGREGLSEREAEARLHRWGPNRLEPPAATPAWRILLRQFTSPLIYILVAAALVAAFVEEYSDAGFIAAVLVLNAVIGFVNESRAERRVRSLASLVRVRARVRRGGRTLDVDGESVVPGDVLLLESGGRVAADVRLLEANALAVDESLLTGESLAVEKDPDPLPGATPLADQRNMAFAGSMVASGRGAGLVVATGADTEVGSIARQMAAVDPQPPPLILRMERFARVVGVVAVVVSVLLVVVGWLRGQPLEEVLLAAIALAVSAVPEGLPVALTVALAVAVSRMADRQVAVRHLPAVEALGSCAVIATDKTGTLTRNELTVERVLAGGESYRATGVGYAPRGDLLRGDRPALPEEDPGLYHLLRAGVLANDASLVVVQDPLGGDGGGDGGGRDARDPDGQPCRDRWTWSGDPTDVALLSLAAKAGIEADAVRRAHPRMASIDFEPERRYAASFHARAPGHDAEPGDGDRREAVEPEAAVRDGGAGGLVCVKGAPERVLEMCTRAAAAGGDGEATSRGLPLDPDAALADARRLMAEGYRVLALAEGELPGAPDPASHPADPSELRYLGLIAMTDPPREGVEDAVARCRRAGVRVVMITGDHAVTALAIGTRIGLAGPGEEALTGSEIQEMDDDTLAERLARSPVVARATPADKLRVVRAWQSRDVYVAVTGDGVNDAPALKQANIGVAMGQAGTDVAREAAELVITDDNFASIVGGIEEGRVAYDNVRKVTYLLVSTGAGEVLLVLAAVALGLPVPLTAAQLLWLNLVTNGIQDVALAFEPGEEGALDRPPRPSRERIFNRIMVERTVLAALVFSGVGLAAFLWWTSQGMAVPEARNLLVQLFVLFEIVHIGNARSETTSVFRLNPLRNPILVAGTTTAVALHLAALHIPFFQNLLGVSPISPAQWLGLLGAALSILVVMELHKWIRRIPGS